MKGLIKFIFVIITFLVVMGCMTSKTRKMTKIYNDNFINGGRIAFIPGDAELESRQLANGLEQIYLRNDNFEVIPDSSIAERFTTYPLRIFDQKLAHNVFIGDKGVKTIKVLARKLNVDFICFSSVVTVGNGGGILLYDLKADKIVTSFYFTFIFTESDGLISAFTNDYEYTQKQMKKCIEFIDNKLNKLL